MSKRLVVFQFCKHIPIETVWKNKIKNFPLENWCILRWGRLLDAIYLRKKKKIGQQKNLHIVQRKYHCDHLQKCGRTKLNTILTTHLFLMNYETFLITINFCNYTYQTYFWLVFFNLWHCVGHFHGSNFPFCCYYIGFIV